MAEGFRLNVEGWGPIEEDSTPDRSAEQPSAKKPRLSLSLNKRATSTAERFVFVDEAKSEALSKRYVPKNTEKSTQWALSTYLMWRDHHMSLFSSLTILCLVQRTIQLNKIFLV